MHEPLDFGAFFPKVSWLKKWPVGYIQQISVEDGEGDARCKQNLNIKRRLKGANTSSEKKNQFT